MPGIEVIKAILSAARETNIYIPVLLALTAGLRRGEVAALRWADIDFEAGTISLKQSLQRIDGVLTFKATKTKASMGKVAVFPLVMEQLRQHKIAQNKERLNLGVAYENHDLVCCWPDGKPLDPDYLTHHFKKITEAIGYPHIRFHDLRHAYATLLMQAEVHPRIAKDQLRHADIATTMEIYSHPTLIMQKEAAQKIGRLLFADLVSTK